MPQTRLYIISFVIAFFALVLSCDKSSNSGDDTCDDCCDGQSLTSITYNPTTKVVELPEYMPKLELPSDNPLTEEGVKLGRFLFYDPILSLDGSMSCASCHKQELSFTDALATSPGVDGINGHRSSMSLLNVGLNYNGLFWDGRVQTLEEQVVIPVEDPIELHESWPNVIEKLKGHDDYPLMFRQAFGIETSCDITKEMAAKALSQFLRTILSYNSKWDKINRNEIDDQGIPFHFTESEYNGFFMFFDDRPDYPDAECGHCHNPPLFTSNNYFNNGIDSVGEYEDFEDKGLGGFTGNRFENGMFRAPSLRNLAFTAPYMHDGRFKTLEEVLDHYNEGGHGFPNEDANIRPLGLSEQQKADVIAYILTLTDESVLTNPELSNPFK